MNLTFMARVCELESPSWIQKIRGIKRGFEKECLRVDQQGLLADTPHPRVLGASLTHPLITTDYSESLLEFITPPTEKLDEPFRLLGDLHRYTVQALPDEVLWLSSMPCKLPQENEIPIANYGQSNLGQLKHIYRRGLGYRYGRMMQTISGIHYNFSLSDTFWKEYQILLKSPLSFRSFVSEHYLGLIRNCLRRGWIIPFLFGASPAVCATFFKQGRPSFEKWGNNTFIGKQATSLRLSDLGYNNKIQSSVNISYNSLDEFIKTMKHAVHTSVPEYKHIGVYKDGEYRQLSDCIFQIEDEHYAMIRPKRVSSNDERMLEAIMRDGIEYIELRALDINPLLPLGVEQETISFLDTFLLTCLLLDSPALTEAENQRLAYNHNQVVLWGRRPGLTLKGEDGGSYSITAWGLDMIEQMLPVAALLDKTYGVSQFTEACFAAKQKFLQPETLPSAIMLQEMTKHHKSYFDFAWFYSLKHNKQFQLETLSAVKQDYFRTLTIDSIQSQVVLEGSDTLSFQDYLSRYLEV